MVRSLTKISKGKSFFFNFILLVGLFLFQGCQKKETDDNFILITLDTQRADHISAYSDQNAKTPNIDFLAENGILYENCHSLIPITLPSHGSIFFSQPPHVFKAYNNGQEVIEDKKRPSFVNIFKKKGFVTASFVSLGVLKAKFGLNESFDFYDDHIPEGRWYSTAGEINQKVFPWLEKNKNQKFFLWIHYSDPHEPYCSPPYLTDLKIYLNDKILEEHSLSKHVKHEITLDLKKGKNQFRLEIMNPYKERETGFHAKFDIFDFSPEPDQKDLKISLSRGWLIQRERNSFWCKQKAYVDIDTGSTARQIKLTFRGRLNVSIAGIKEEYKKEVEYMDTEIGKLIEKMKELELFGKTHILMVGDHGEGLGEYRSYLGGQHVGHIHFLYDVYMKVPLIIYSPGGTRKNLRIREPVTLLDIAPTILKIMGFRKLSSFKGRNLLSLKKEEITIFEETYKPEAARDKFALHKFPWHLILTPETREYELFDLRKDPDEQDNIYQKNNLPKEVTSLKRKLDSMVLEIMMESREFKVDKQTEDMLRDLGYIK